MILNRFIDRTRIFNVLLCILVSRWVDDDLGNEPVLPMFVPLSRHLWEVPFSLHFLDFPPHPMTTLVLKTVLDF